MGSPGIGPNAGGPCAPKSGPPPSRCRATFCGRGGDTGRGSAGWCSPSWARRTGAAGARGGGGGARERARASRRCATRRWEWAGGRSTNLDRRRRAPGRARRPIGRRGCRREGDGRRGRRRHPPGGASRRPRTFARTARWGSTELFASVDVAFALASPDDAAATRARREGFARRSSVRRWPWRPRDARTRGGRATNTVAVARATPPGTRIDDTPRSGSVATIARRSRAMERAEPPRAGCEETRETSSGGPSARHSPRVFESGLPWSVLEGNFALSRLGAHAHAPNPRSLLTATNPPPRPPRRVRSPRR